MAEQIGFKKTSSGQSLGTVQPPTTQQPQPQTGNDPNAKPRQGR